MTDSSETRDSKFELSSRVFPTAEDIAVWDSLSPAEKRAVIERDEEAGFKSGIAEPETLKQRLERVRATLAHAL